MGAPKGGNAQFPGGVCSHSARRLRGAGKPGGGAGGERRARAATAAPGEGGRQPGPGLPGLRGETRQRDGLSAARASARPLVIQHPDFQTGDRRRSSSLAVPDPGLRESVRPTLHAAPGGARRAEPGAQSTAPGSHTAGCTGHPGRRRRARRGGGLRVSGLAQPLTTAAPLGRPGASPSVRRARPRAAAPQPGNFWPPPQRLGGESGTRAWDGERAEQGLPRK